jgi:parafibromin
VRVRETAGPEHTDFIQAARLRRIPPVSLHFGHSSLSSADPLLPSFFPASKEPHLHPPSPLPEEPAGADETTAATKIRAAERPFKDRNALLNARGRDFHAVLTSALRRQDELRKGGKDSGPNSRHESSGLALSKPKLEKSLGDGGMPIILVPSASQTLITIYNAKEFLEDGVFVPSEERMRATKGGKPESVTVQRKLMVRGDRAGTTAASMSFEVRDKPASLKGNDWGRVVAVFVLGKEWQFKDWPFRDHVEIFNRAEGLAPSYMVFFLHL